MAVLLERTLPEGITLEMLDESMAKLGVHEDPPAGLVVHVTLMERGRVRVVDVWDSLEAYESFERDRLVPASKGFSERHDLPPDGPEAETTIVQVHAMVKGRTSA